MAKFQISEQDYLELQETVLAYAQVKNLDEDFVLQEIDSFLGVPNPQNSLLVWEALAEDDLGLVRKNPQLQKLTKIAEQEFKNGEKGPVYH